MPINKIVATKRGKAAIAAALLAAAAGGWQSYKDTSERVLPPAVILATDALILPWEGMVLTSHWDRFAKIYDICAGITRINGRPVGPNMRFTRSQCEEMTREQIYNDYYLPLVKAVPGYTNFPIGVQAAMLSGAYNFGVNGMLGATATRLHRLAYGMQARADAAEAEASEAKDAENLALSASKMGEADRLRAAAASQYRKGCEAQTAWNKAGGQVVQGLVKRREMGDAQRKGEAEICVSGLKDGQQ